MAHYLWKLRPYYRQTAGQLVLGSLAGVVMNTAVVLPAVCLRDSFNLPGERPTRESVVVVQYAGQRAGIVVDRLAGELQAVIKPLGAIFRHLQGIGGSTILGSGEVALILDISALIKLSGQAEQRLLARPEQRSA